MICKCSVCLHVNLKVSIVFCRSQVLAAHLLLANDELTRLQFRRFIFPVGASIVAPCELGLWRQHVVDEVLHGMLTARITVSIREPGSSSNSGGSGQEWFIIEGLALHSSPVPKP